MFLGNVVGNVVATVKDPLLSSCKLLVVQPISLSGTSDGSKVIAVDSVGVGVGEKVFCVRGKEAAFSFLPKQALTDVAIVGKIDTIVNAEGEL